MIIKLNIKTLFIINILKKRDELDIKQMLD